MANSMVTTKAKIMGSRGVDSLEIEVETTQPEESTIVKTLFGGPCLSIDDIPVALQPGTLRHFQYEHKCGASS